MKYIIDSDVTGGSGCDEIFETFEDAKFHFDLYTENERQGLFIAEIED